MKTSGFWMKLSGCDICKNSRGPVYYIRRIGCTIQRITYVHIRYIRNFNPMGVTATLASFCFVFHHGLFTLYSCCNISWGVQEGTLEIAFFFLKSYLGEIYLHLSFMVLLFSCQSYYSTQDVIELEHCCNTLGTEHSKNFFLLKQLKFKVNFVDNESSFYIY